jgi:hypothetical protein
MSSDTKAALVVLGALAFVILSGAAIVAGGGTRKSDWDIARSQIDTQEPWQRALNR